MYMLPATATQPRVGETPYSLFRTNTQLGQVHSLTKPNPCNDSLTGYNAVATGTAYVDCRQHRIRSAQVYRAALDGVYSPDS